MSKENNLKDYLTDLYDGISSKKPDASRNPQNFRAEIEAIKTGGIPWDGDYTIEGDALPEPPKAYYATSAGELPTDAPDGSLAVVESDSIEGEWEFNKTLTPIDKPFEEGWEDVRVPFTSTAMTGLDAYYFMYYDSITLIGDSNFIEEVTFANYSNHESNWMENTYYKADEGWIDAAQIPVIVNFLKDTDDATFKKWLPQNATRISGGHTLYSRENGEWVSKGEI